MKVGTIIFTYNRPLHTEQVLNGLKSNTVLPTTLYIYQDGLKKEEHRDKWEETKNLIDRIDWVNVKIRRSKHNKGLAESIISGVTEVLYENDCVIVLEDDCVPAKGFISYMYQCFERYKDNNRVFSVSGYDFLGAEKADGQVYFSGRSSSWGWGTWKDRWNNFRIDNEILNRIYQNKEKSIYLSKWGNDLENMLIDRIAGHNDSWAVYWSLYAIENMATCVVPRCSLIKNIGMDGTGVHCGSTSFWKRNFSNAININYDLPEIVMPNAECSDFFIKKYGGWTSLYNNSDKEKVIIYGLGVFYKRNEEYFAKKYQIEGFVDKQHNGYYGGKKIISVDDIQNYGDAQIMLLVIDVLESRRIVTSLIEKYGVKREKIKILDTVSV